MAEREATEQDQQRPRGRVVSTTRPAATPAPPPRRRPAPRNIAIALAFLTPALVLLGALVVYPIFFSVLRSFYSRLGDTFVGLDNYREMFSSERTLIAIRNNAIWVVVAPTLATAVGLIYAVLAERVRWQTAFKVAVFMPMAISGLATGVIFRLVYEDDPDRGLANAVVTSVVDVFRSSGAYEGARPSQPDLLQSQGRAFVTSRPFAPGDEPATLGLLAIRPRELPDDADEAPMPRRAPDTLSGVVWLDFTRGGGGEAGTVDPTELGLPGVEIEALDGGEVVATTVSDTDGVFAFDDLESGEYQLRLSEANFRPPWGGVNWLSPTLVTPAIIAAWLWIWIGFAMIVIGAGLSAIPRDVQEAARVDGAGEWQVFRRVTVPLLTPVLLVVLVTLVINVLKVFDLVLIIPPGSVQNEANVIALEMWRVSFGGARDQGLGSALSVLLFLLVLPAMAFNIKRFRAER
ncbi:MAG TPA: ABC transporter permease subunit [Acidimicrobiales bacterium]|nr:ABC transporter permease subunit [Acidimicrobiales bacterium]